MDNKDLAETYNKVFKNDSDKFFSFNNFPESRLIMDMLEGWSDLRVLEIGCGTGEDALFLAQQGIHITATDASEEMLRITREKTENQELNSLMII